MTESTDTTINPLNAEQTARAAALSVAKELLQGNAGTFGIGTNGRAPAELIELADYIVGTEPEPQLDRPSSFGQFLTDLITGQGGAVLHGPDCDCQPEETQGDEVDSPEREAAAAARRARHSEQDAFWDGTPERAAALRDAATKLEAVAQVNIVTPPLDDDAREKIADAVASQGRDAGANV